MSLNVDALPGEARHGRMVAETAGARRESVLVLAAELGFPRHTWPSRPWEGVGPGEPAWREWCAAADPGQLFDLERELHDERCRNAIARHG